jgi:PAS domain S-box-containing protein
MPTKPEQEINPESSQPIRILIVEDDLVDRTLLQRMLAQTGLPIAEIKYTEYLGAALEILDKNHFDIVLLDLNLPDSSGIDTLVKINEKHPGVANIVVTGESSEGLGLKTVSRGAQEYLAKGKFNIYSLSKSIYYAIERKKIEHKLHLAEEKYRKIFENSAVAITVADDQNRLISWNKFTESLLGMSEKDLLLRPVKSLYPDEEWEKIRNLNIRKKGLQHHFETKMFRQNGEIIDVDVSITVLKDSEDRVTGSIGVVTDITVRKKAEEKLKETMEIKSQFISTVSHELRTPLASMKEAVAIVLDGTAGKINDEQKSFLNIAKRNIDRLARLIDDVLNFQKLDYGKMKFDMQENDLGEVVRDAYNTMVSLAKKNKLDFILELEDNLPKAVFDSDRITQVITNLVGNSIKFTPEKGRVSVNVRRQADELAIQVKDTGAGIPKDALPRIFDVFYCVHRPGEKIPGTGLGLAIVKKIVTMHGGRIDVESELNKGSTFTVFLPLASKYSSEILSEKADKVLESAVVNKTL